MVFGEDSRLLHRVNTLILTRVVGLPCNPKLILFILGYKRFKILFLAPQIRVCVIRVVLGIQ